MVEKHYPELNATKLMEEVFQDMPQTPADDMVKAEAEVDQEDALEDIASSQEVPAIEAHAIEASDSLPPST